MSNPSTLKRRGFLAAALGLPAVAVAASWAARRKIQPIPEAAPIPVQADASGYHETEHIREYYRTADF